MTQDEWLTSNSPHDMLKFLTEGQASKRKFRLFAVACCRSVLHLCTDPRIAATIDIAEQYIDGRATNSERSKARRAVQVITQTRSEPWSWEAHVNDAGAWAAYWACGRHPDLEACYRHCALVVGRTMQRDAKLSNGNQSAAWLNGRAVEWSREAIILRDIIGNPFCPESVDASWLTPAVFELAGSIYEKKAFDRMPQLADELEKAGCIEAAILEHCRGQQSHVRGCWVIDQLLRKETKEDFDELVGRFERRLLPQMKALAAELHSSYPHLEIKTFSHRHAECVHSMGLSCESPDLAPASKEGFPHICINIFNIRIFSVRGFVRWSNWDSNGVSNVITGIELMTPIYTSTRADDLDAFLKEAPNMLDALRRTLRRGRPPGPLMRLRAYLLGELDWPYHFLRGNGK